MLPGLPAGLPEKRSVDVTTPSSFDAGVKSNVHAMDDSAAHCNFNPLLSLEIFTIMSTPTIQNADCRCGAVTFPVMVLTIFVRDIDSRANGGKRLPSKRKGSATVRLELPEGTSGNDNRRANDKGLSHMGDASLASGFHQEASSIVSCIFPEPMPEGSEGDSQ
jgi:hypothetical protein